MKNFVTKSRRPSKTVVGNWVSDRSKYSPHIGRKELAKAAKRAATQQGERYGLR